MPSIKLGTTEAAELVGISARRLRALIAEGRIEAERIAGRWLVDGESLERLLDTSRDAGRPWSPGLAWAYLRSLDGDPDAADDLTAVQRSRLRQRLRTTPSLEELAVRLARRAQSNRYRAHPSVVDDLLNAGCVTGLSAAAPLSLGLAIREGEYADVYLPAAHARQLIDELVLRPTNEARRANVVIRSVPNSAWQLGDRQVAPRLAVALDLAEHSDSRTREVAQGLALGTRRLAPDE